MHFYQSQGRFQWPDDLEFMNLSKMEGFRMNRRSSGSLFLSKAIGGFIQYKAAEGLSPTTLRSYEDHLQLWVEHLGDKPVNWIKTVDVQEYFVWLRTEYEPRRFGGDRRALSAKTVRNFYISLCAFFTWASREFDLPSPMKAVPSPKFEEPPIEPFTKEEVEALLKACETSKEVNDLDRRKFTMRRSTAKRDQTLIMMLLIAAGQRSRGRTRPSRRRSRLLSSSILWHNDHGRLSNRCADSNPTPRLLDTIDRRSAVDI